MDFESHGLAKHLLQKLEDFHCIEIKELDSLKSSPRMTSFEIIESIKK